ncbi:hypothetical protein LX36DRAFT_670591 [Colletotrichum falcatum]|nr:hypothetical protein LX36DRAFT_670591 [Colletotrichum falcatum]
MVSIKNLLIATLVSSIVAIPIASSDLPEEEDIHVVNRLPVIESRGNGGGYSGVSCDASQKDRLDQEIQNRYQLKSRLDDEINRLLDRRTLIGSGGRYKKTDGQTCKTMLGTTVLSFFLIVKYLSEVEMLGSLWIN